MWTAASQSEVRGGESSATEAVQGVWHLQSVLRVQGTQVPASHEVDVKYKVPSVP